MRKSTLTLWATGFGVGAVLLLSDVTVAGQLSTQAAGNVPMANIPRCTTIQAIVKNLARASESSSGAIQFSVSTAAANRPLVGQMVCLQQGSASPSTSPLPAGGASRASVNRAVFVAWPAEAHKKDTVSVGYMESWVKLSNTGRIDGTTKTWTNNTAQGFTGGVKVQLQDKNGNVLPWDMPVKTYGVNADNPVSNASAPSTRTADWNFPVPPDVLNRVARIRIIQRHTPEGRWDQAIEMAKELGEVLKTYAEIYTTVQSGGF